jgi:hypothetical protein
MCRELLPRLKQMVAEENDETTGADGWGRSDHDNDATDIVVKRTVESKRRALAALLQRAGIIHRA